MVNFQERRENLSLLWKTIRSCSDNSTTLINTENLEHFSPSLVVKKIAKHLGTWSSQQGSPFVIVI